MVLQGIVVLLVAAALGLAIARPKAEYVWCAWSDLAETAATGAGPTTIYAFEDLAAYHLWFAARHRNDVHVAVIKGVPEVKEDSAFFLPRGFDRVTTLNAGDKLPDDFYIVYRADKFETGSGPVSWFKTQQLDPGEPIIIEKGGQKAVLVRLRRQATAK
jgi:hypothetical protein